MKRKTAKEFLAEAFHQIAEKKPADKITVIDIAENCGYSTTTFYRHFKDKYDLMSWEYTRAFQETAERTEREGKTWQETFLELTRLLYGQRLYLRNLLLHTGGHDSFSCDMQRIHYEGLKKLLMNKSGADQLDAHLDLCARVYSHGTVDMACEWIMGEYDMSVEDLSKVFEDTLPENLRQLLS